MMKRSLLIVAAVAAVSMLMLNLAACNQTASSSTAATCSADGKSICDKCPKSNDAKCSMKDGKCVDCKCATCKCAKMDGKSCPMKDGKCPMKDGMKHDGKCKGKVCSKSQADKGDKKGCCCMKNKATTCPSKAAACQNKDGKACPMKGAATKPAACPIKSGDACKMKATTKPAGEINKAAATQVASTKYVNKRCPIMGGEIDPAKVNDSLIREFNGQKIAFCCAGCPQMWEKLNDAEKLAKLNAAK